MKSKTLWQRIMFTVMVVILFRFGSVFPVPLINPEILKVSMESVKSTMFGLYNMLSGGGFSQASIFAMGVSPYINASIIVQLLTVALPPLERLKKDGAEGQKKLMKLNRYVSVVLAVVQAAGFYLMLSRWGALTTTGVLPMLTVICAFTAGSSFVMWLGERVTESGVGNGISIVLVSGILSGIPGSVTSLLMLDPKYLIALVAAVVFAAIVFVVFMNEAEQKVPVVYSRAQASGGYSNKQTSHIPLKVNMSGVMPIIFASTILSIPSTIQMFAPSLGTEGVGKKIFDMFLPTSPVYGVIYFVLIILFNYFYVSIQYEPDEMANSLKQQNGVIPGIRPGKSTADFLKKAIRRLTFIGAVFLGLIAVVPIILNASLKEISFYMGGTSLLIIVGVAIETVKQIHAQESVRKYSSLL